MFKLTNHRFNANGFWSNPIDRLLFRPIIEDFALFDQNGYDLTPLEQRYAHANDCKFQNHREHRHTIKQSWFEQHEQLDGSILNHSNLFERKAYSGQAKNQLLEWSHEMPRCHMLLSLKPKWGLDFSMDYVNRKGDVFEILHWEYDGFDFTEVDHMRTTAAEILQSIDWQDAALRLLDKKSSWHHLDFFQQSAWKCNYFGMPHERFKMVAWA